MEDSLVASFFVKGKPEPAGSKKAVTLKGKQFSQVVDANRKAGPYKERVAGVASYAMKGDAPVAFRVPLGCRMVFLLERPKGHWLKDGSLSTEGLRNPFPTSRPDALKLARGVEDAMTGIVYSDDSQIVNEYLEKRYQAHPDEQIGVQVTVWLLADSAL